MTRHVLLLVVSLTLIVADMTFAEDSDLPNQYEADGVSVPAASADEPVSELSIEKAALHLDHGTVAWSKQKKCVSCHTNGTYLFIRPALSRTLGKPSEKCVRSLSSNSRRSRRSAPAS